MDIFYDEKAVDVLTKEGYRVTLIGKDAETLMNRVVNPKSKLCRYSDELSFVYAVTVPSYPALPYMNMHKYPIKIGQADMGRMSDPSTHLRSNTMKCKVKPPTAKPGVFRLRTVLISV
jgi:hypothetical protein